MTPAKGPAIGAVVSVDQLFAELRETHDAVSMTAAAVSGLRDDLVRLERVTTERLAAAEARLLQAEMKLSAPTTQWRATLGWVVGALGAGIAAWQAGGVPPLG
ncbi:hypothetical protein [Streptomyces albidoflavus]|uniref:hypothetical protein n=1 Tax=Streptomyces albidoflavus TaxID=1886 RepID=UPI00332BB06F